MLLGEDECWSNAVVPQFIPLTPDTVPGAKAWPKKIDVNKPLLAQALFVLIGRQQMAAPLRRLGPGVALPHNAERTLSLSLNLTTPSTHVGAHTSSSSISINLSPPPFCCLSPFFYRHSAYGYTRLHQPCLLISYLRHNVKHRLNPAIRASIAHIGTHTAQEVIQSFFRKHNTNFFCIVASF